MPAIILGNATKPSRFGHFWQGAPGAQSLAPATRNDIWTSKNGPYMVCFVHFDLEMCFAPQWRALFRHLNFQKWSENGVLCTFWLRNVLRATTACTFSTSQLPKVLRAPGVLYILTCKCASRHNGVQFFISHLASWLRTRRFSEPTFRPSGAPNYWKNTVFRDFPTFSRICIFFLLTLLSSNLSLLSASSLLCFSSVHIVGSLTSKLPSMNALERARLSALHCGAFMTNYEHSQCDVEMTPMCEQCSCGDDRVHWLRCPRYQQIRNDIPDWCSDNLQLPPCTLHHLLVPRQLCMVRWRQMLCQSDSAGIVFLVPPTKQGYHHVFFGWLL